MRVLWALHQCHFISNPKTVKPDNFCNRSQTVAILSQPPDSDWILSSAPAHCKEIGAKYLLNVARSGHFA